MTITLIYPKSYFDYKTMGFGEVYQKRGCLIKLLKIIWINDCEMKEDL